MGYATDLAKAKIAEFNDVAAKANSAGVSADFFQRFTTSAPAAALSIDQVSEALQRFNQSAADKLGGSEIQQRMKELVDAGNFAGNSGVTAFASATTTEQRLRAIVSLIDQATTKGERLAALDIAGRAFGEPVRSALAANSGLLDQMIQRADTMSNAKLISPEDIGRAIELKDRMDAAQKVLAERWKPIQDDLAQLGFQYHTNWVAITQDLAAAVGYATQLYTALKQVPDWFANRIGNASIWKSITDATTTPESRAAAEAAHGISSDPKDIGMMGANAKLRTALQNYGNVTRSMQDATAVQSALRGDTSKAPSDKATGDQADAVDRAINTVRRHTQQVEADTRAVGLGEGALARFRAEAAELSAVQANGGKETEAQAAAFKTLQDQAAAAADALAKARVNSDISFGRQTALLSPEDLQIANQLKGVYGTDIPTALNSAEAAQIRFNNALKSIGDSFRNDLTEPLVDFVTGSKSASQSFQAFASSFIRDIARMAIQAAVIKPMMGALGGGIGIPGFASGTDSAPGGLAWVGERGPELVRLPKGAAVYPNHVSMQFARSIPALADGGVIGGGSPAPLIGRAGGGSSITMGDIHVHGGATNGTPVQNRELAAMIAQHVQDAARAAIGQELRTQMRPGGILRR
ncbi:phage tail tape measure C-terminal domain-containing protein [Bradyrhizobium sp. SZCCHNR1004]|uniref:phage tail tape measure C-terminal domain-containing protein n=1 Tax=Bradyrhizobium sp. SZCCHNR1004 TaxID=3057335 RepID=UPI002916D281|nr:phage tail tape measure C-terminal domain-containing protein [Bradyrhizobium sp. SZCCHNR1004]